MHSPAAVLLISLLMSSLSDTQVGTYDIATNACLGAPRGCLLSGESDDSGMMVACPSEAPDGLLREMSTANRAAKGMSEVQQEHVTERLTTSGAWDLSLAMLAQDAGPTRFKLSPEPLWTLSGTWSRDGTKLLLVDIGKQKLLSYDIKGQGTETYLPPPNGMKIFPTHIQAVEAGYVVEWSNRLLTVSSDNNLFLFERQIPIRGARGSQEEEVTAIWQWSAIDDWLVVIGDVQYEDGREEAVLFRTALRSPCHVEVLSAIEDVATPAEASMMGYYAAGLQLLTHTDNNAYFIELGEDNDIVQIGLGSRNLGFFPDSLVSTMPLSADNIGRRLKEFYRAIEDREIVSGIFPYREHLLLLARRPKENGTAWSLIPLDLCGKRALQPIPLEIEANHVLTVPGSRYWAFIEKGPVEAFKDQRIESMVVVPVSWLDRQIFTHADFTPCREETKNSPEFAAYDQETSLETGR